MELLGLHLVGTQVGDDPFRSGEDERKTVGGRHPHVAFPVLCEGGDFVAGETVFQGVGSEPLRRMIPQQALRAGSDPQPAAPAFQQAGRMAERGGRKAVRGFEEGPPFEPAAVDGEKSPPEYRRQHRRVVEADDILHVAALEACVPQAHAVVHQEPRSRRHPYVVPGVLAEAVGRKAFRKQGVVEDRLMAGVAAGDAVVDVDPEMSGRIGEERRHVLAVEPLHEGAVLHRVPFQVELRGVGQHAFETAPDPACAVFRDRDGVDELAQGLFAQSDRPGELLFIGIAHRIAPVERADPEIVFRIAETAGKVAGVVEPGRSPCHDVLFQRAGPDVDLVEIVPLCPDVDRVVYGRQREYGGLGERGDTFVQRPVRFGGSIGAGIDDAHSVRSPEPDPAFGVAAAAQKFRGVGQSQRIADIQVVVVFVNRASGFPPPTKIRSDRLRAPRGRTGAYPASR